jgi:hypothetical protein
VLLAQVLLEAVVLLLRMQQHLACGCCALLLRLLRLLLSYCSIAASPQLPLT